MNSLTGDRAIKLVVVVPSYREGDIENFFRYAFIVSELAESLVDTGINVTVVSRSSRNAQFTRQGVSYCFVKDNLGENPRPWQYSHALVMAVRRCKADIIHMHGLSHPVLTMAIWAARRRAKLVAEFHSDRRRTGVGGVVQRLAASRLDLILFSNQEDADHWRQWLGLPAERFALSREGACRLQYSARSGARAVTGLTGHPVFLWNSRLISRRNPLRVLAGFRKALDRLPLARFYMLIPNADSALLEAVRKTVRQDERLATTVSLVVGKRPHEEMADYYNSADYLLSGSTGDAYGFGVADAMACGVIPIVPDLPTFRDITRNGEIGGLWQVDDSDSLCQQILTVVDATYDNIDEESRRATQSFQDRLSYPAIARNLNSLYQRYMVRETSRKRTSI